MTLIFDSPQDWSMKIAKRARDQRLALNLSQASLAARSGVSHGTIKKFERTGKISLESLLKLAIILKAINDFEHLFRAHHREDFNTLDEIISLNTTRKRGRK